jgi:hypothetical protein
MLLLAQPASALCTFYTDPKFPVMKPEVLDTDIRITLLDGYAVVEITKVFHNPDASTPQVGDIIFPLPSEHAFITALGLAVDGAWHNASVVDREEGRRNFSEAVNERRDASLLEHLGGSQYALRVTLPPQENRTLRVRYEEPLTRVNGEFLYRYPLTEEALSDPRHLRLELDARTAGSFADIALRSPAWGKLDAVSGDHARWVLDTRGKGQLQEDLVLAWRTDAAGEAQLLVQRGNATSHFVFHLVPGPKLLEQAQPLPRDVVVLVDASGSMGKPGLQQDALRAAEQVLGALGPGDRLQVGVFRSQPELWAGALLNATEARKAAALGFLAGQKAEGSTNLEEAILGGLHELAPGRQGAQPELVLISDGDATVGLQDGHALVHALGDVNRRGRDVVIETLQVGPVEHQAQRFDPWGRTIPGAEPLLEVVAKENYGTGLPVAQAPALRALLEGPGKVLLRNVTVRVEGLDASGVGPLRVPLLFEGGEVQVAGSFRGGGVLSVSLRGDGALGPVELRWDFDTSEAPEHPLAERVGAMLRLREALDGIRVFGASDERVQLVKAIAGRFGYVTPYTSLLVDLPTTYAMDEKLASRSAMTTGSGGASAPSMGMPMMLEGDGDWYRPTSLAEHPLVKDREVDRYVALGSSEGKALLAHATRWLAGSAERGALVESAGQVVLVADQPTLDAIAWQQGRFLPGLDAGPLLAVLGACAALLARRRSP